jgi:Uma2 family endonuclease
MAIKVPVVPPLRYADASVTCGERQLEKVNGIDVLTNPILIIEVLSDSTERYDRTGKFEFYKSIPSFKEYLLIAQDEPRITQFIKQDDGHWQPDEVIGRDEKLYLPSIDCTLALSDVYQDIKLNN